MSSFAPLNVFDDPTTSKNDIEEHSRELQIEEAFKLYQKALNLQKQQKLEEAYTQYEELFKLEVISNHYYEEESYIRGIQNGMNSNNIDELNYLAPNVKSLRYLVFRNRGFLCFEMIKNKILPPSGESEQDISEEKDQKLGEKQLFYSMMDDMLICLIYQEADEKLLSILYELFSYMDIKRLTRFTVEYLLASSEESDDLFGMIGIDQNTKRKHEFLLKQILSQRVSSDEQTELDRRKHMLNKKLSFLTEIKKDFQMEVENDTKQNFLEVALNINRKQVSWNYVIETLNKAIKFSEDKERYQDLSRSRSKEIDSYCFTERPIEIIKFLIPNDDTSSDHDNVKAEVIHTQDDMNNDLEKESQVQRNGHDDKASEVNQVEVSSPLESMKESKTEESAAFSKENSCPTTEHIEDAGSTRNSITQRSSRRVKNRSEVQVSDIKDIALTYDCFKDTANFINQLNGFFEDLCKSTEEKVKISDIIRIYVDDNCDSPTVENRKYITDFAHLINNWIPKKYSVFTSDNTVKENVKKDDEKIRLLEVLNAFGDKKKQVYRSEEIQLLDDHETHSEVANILRQINEESCNLGTLKLKILKRLLCFVQQPEFEDANRTMLTHYIWTHELYDKVRDWILFDENTILANLSTNTFQPLIFEDDSSRSAFAVSIYELLVDHYITLKNNFTSSFSSNLKKGNQKLNKSSLNNVLLELVKLGDKISRWEVYLEGIFNYSSVANEGDTRIMTLLIRYMWALTHKECSQQNSWEIKTKICDRLTLLLTVLKKLPKGFETIPLPNYKYIPELSVESVDNQLTTTSVLAILSSILFSRTEAKNGEAIKLLHYILIESSEGTDKDVEVEIKDDLDEGALAAVKSFLEESSIDMKISLWNILLSYYQEGISSDKLQYGFENFLGFVTNYLASDEFNGSGQMKKDNMIKVIDAYAKHLKSYLRVLMSNRWSFIDKTRMSTGSYVSIMSQIVKIFELLLVFCVHEEAALLNSFKVSLKVKSIKAYDRFRDLLVDTSVLLLFYYKEILFNEISSVKDFKPEEMLANFLKYFHEQLAWRGLCDSSNGIFLKFSQDMLFNMDSSKTSGEIFQLISCRYHYFVSGEGSTTVNHGTSKTASLDARSAAEIAEFVLPFCFVRNPLVNLPKSDLRALVDDIYEAMGDPDFEMDEVLTKNESSFNFFLDWTPLTPRFVRDCFYGLQSCDLAMPRNNSNVIKNGLYYLHGLFIFSSYKIRKKSTQSRLVELESIIKLLRNDLIYCSDRVESWLLLGQAYGFLVEDDLIWTSDKLTVPDRKATTANIQRKSLLCYLMAINASAKLKDEASKSSMKTIIPILLTSLSKEMYSAIKPPMSMLAFKVQNYPVFMKNSTGSTSISLSLPWTFKQETFMKVILRSLRLSIKAKPSDWTCHYYLAKVQRRLGMPPTEVINSLKKSISVSQKSPNSGEPIIEPHYLLCSIIYKYVKNGQSDMEESLNFLKSDPVLQVDPLLKLETETDFYQLIVACLKKVISYDKKKWHHKPKYRLAKVLYDDLHRPYEAKQEINSIVSLRASNKTLVSIWKPENERQGKHFHYTYQYALFYVVLLTESKDLSNLINMLPKLRRSNSTMINLPSVWEKLCSSICKLARELFHINDSFTESFMSPISYQKFMANAKSMMDTLKKKDIPKDLEKHICMLNAISDMKKLNNGFGPTSLIDDTMIAIFIQVYRKVNNNPISETENEDTKSPGGKIKKLAKRDFFPLVNDILKISKKMIESTIKMNSNYYSDLLTNSDNSNCLDDTENGTMSQRAKARSDSVTGDKGYFSDSSKDFKQSCNNTTKHTAIKRIKSFDDLSAIKKQKIATPSFLESGKNITPSHDSDNTRDDNYKNE
ncbi:Piso0_002581 [Millerozyma farinosa CBS 7064]|uniref:Piso0_002581 protein n=1 Tax=Pichia sorbitophila (strain ATCC MYA-4447 / BCRC 22081 / CBS 7064 / NBRC 10061 / NRRL Y-12695) TaxID=559304 RepID=G8YD00_PICSO|nr:Piso0_002581 [Millerozyma farinosa CBS 7064]